jgi:PAS domain S-box-containing protein
VGAGLVVVYFVAGKVGLTFAVVHASASAVWPPTGVALAALLLLGLRAWPAIFAGAFLVNVTTAGSVLTSLGIASGNTVEAVAGAYLVNRFANGRHVFQRAPDIIRFVLLAALLGTAISATVGVLSLIAGGLAPWRQAGGIWLTWWLGDAVGAIVVTPLVVLGATAEALPDRRRLGEAGLLVLALLVSGALIFAAPNPYPLTFLCLPSLVWAAFRFEQVGVAVAVTLFSLIAIWATVAGVGPLAQWSPAEALLLLQAFMGIVATTMLPVGALVATQRRTDAEREALRGAAERAHARLEAVLNQMQAGVLIAEAPSGRVVYANQQVEAIHGRSFQPLSFEEYGQWRGFHRDGRPCAPHEWPLARSIQAGELVLDEEIEFIRPDGTRVTVLVRSAPVREADRIVAAVAVFQDVTERAALLEREQAARAEAESASRAKDEFLAMLGHELRNPLGAIATGVSILGRTAADSAHAVQARRIIERQVAHLTEIIEDLLDVARVTSGKIALTRKALDVAELVAESVETLQAAGRTGRHRVTVVAEPVWIEADATRIEQVFSNLLGNALKYTPAGGEIRVSVGAEGDHALLEVVDTGVGIAPEVLPRVFDVFAQGQRPLDRSQGGLGLGLTLVRRLVELHGGTVTARSAGVGRGAAFTVRLPRMVPPATPRGRGTVEAPGLIRQRVIVVDDNADGREMLRTLLELEGHEVGEAGDGPSGLEAIEALRPDTAIIDIGLPGLDGYEIAGRLRRGGFAGRLVALTGYGQPEDSRRARAAGFDDHLMKPVDVDRLRAALATPRRRSPPP